MGFIFKFVIILIVFSFIVYVMKAITRISAHLRRTVKDVKSLREQMGGQTSAADMVRCSGCGAFVTARDAGGLTATQTFGYRVFISGGVRAETR